MKETTIVISLTNESRERELAAKIIEMINAEMANK